MRGSAAQVVCETTTGPIVVDVYHDWAPHGAQRFLEMVTSGFFSTRIGLFRAVKNFLCQTGVAGDPAEHKRWRAKGTIPDDPQWLPMQTSKKNLKRGFVSFAGGGKNSRGTEFFFAFRDLQLGGSPWEVPFGTLVGDASFHAMDRWYAGYGDMPGFGGHAPNQGRIYQQGVSYLENEFPDLDYIERCDVIHQR